VHSYTKTIVCLANSRKVSGRCIAGKEYADGVFGDWIRPVGARADEEISEDDRRYRSGDYAKLLHIVAIPMTRPVPDGFQIENRRIDDEFNREPLKAELKKSAIAYVFPGRELGARSEDPDCYENGKVQYGGLARTPQFREGLERLRTGAETKRIALLCAERKFLALMERRRIEERIPREVLNEGCLLSSEHQPHHCHRRLVAEYLRAKWGDIDIVHIE
jgi:hypothetical protein